MLTWTSCKKENRCDCFKGTGKISSKEIKPDTFKAIQVESNINVEIIEGTENKITVSAGSKLIDFVEFEIKDTTLFIRDKNKCNWSRSFKNEINVIVEVISISHITQFGTGKIFSSDTIHAPYFLLELANSGDVQLIVDASTFYCNNHVSTGDITLSGKAGLSYVFNSGNGFIYAENLLTDITFLGNHNTGKCYVNAKDWLEVEIDYSGDVYYRGNPPLIKKNITGTGKLIQL